MRTRVLLVAVVLVGGAAAVGVVGSVVRADTPQLTVTVEGSPIAGGGDRTVTENPSMRIEASANEAIDGIVVRVNGETVREFSPGSANVSVDFVIQLADNEASTVRVIVRDTADGVESTQFTLTKDGVAPFVGFDSPFETAVQSRPPEAVTVSASDVRFAGTLQDLTGVRTVIIERTHRYERVDEQRVVSNTYQLQEPGTTFSRAVFLGYGENDVSFTMIDRLGNRRTYNIELTVRDEQAPNLTVDTPPATVRAGSVVLSGEATDNTQIDEITYEVEGRVGPATLVSSQGPRVDPARQSLPFERRVPLTTGPNTIRVSATDVAGNTVTEEFVVRYNDTVVPLIAVDTVTRAGDSVVVRGSVRAGSYRRVTVETIDVASTETIDFEPLYDSDPTGDRLTINESLDASGSDEVRVVLRVRDANGEEHVRVTTVSMVEPTAETGSPTTGPGSVTPGTSVTTPTVTDVVTPGTVEATPETTFGPPFDVGLERLWGGDTVESDDELTLLVVGSVGLALVSTYLTVRRRRIW
jgi:hypothetical protein